MHGTMGSSGARLRLAGLGMALATVTAGCGAVASVVGGGLPDRPANERAIPPVVLIAQGTSAAGEYRAWVYSTSDGMTCLEVGHRGGSGSGCGPLGDDPSGGRGSSDAGQWLDGSTTEASAAWAVVHDTKGPDVRVPVVGADIIVPGLRFWVAGFPNTANPVSVTFLDKDGNEVATATLP